MGYVAVSGGREAIEQSINLLKYHRAQGDDSIEIAAIRDKLSLLVDRVMGEAGLYSRDYAALALKQCEGSVEEAVFLLRAYRSTLTRDFYTMPIDTKGMRVIRRISSAFKDIKGGQILGPTYDYTQRLIDFSIKDETRENLSEFCKKPDAENPEPVVALPRVSDMLKQQGMITEYGEDDTPPDDITAHMLTFPASRSAKLQTLARADTGFVGGLAYSSLRAYGVSHPTVGELRCGYIEVEIPYMFDETQTLCAGEILMTEVESFMEADSEKEGGIKLAIGYGAAFGRNENKAIAMSILDRTLDEGGSRPTNNEEFVLMSGDSLEMSGFISHLKLPHYVTFQSKLDSIRKTSGRTPDGVAPPEKACGDNEQRL